MESIADKLSEINRIRNNEQVMTWVKNFEEKFVKDLKNARNIKAVNLERTPEQLREDAKAAMNDYKESFREEAATLPEQDFERDN